MNQELAHTTASNELWRLTARQVVGLLQSGEVSPSELVEAAAKRIEETDGILNAVPTVCLDRAVEHAQRLANKVQKPPKSGPWLGGLPIVVKDLNDVSGVRTTYGSPLFSDHVPEVSDVMVETLERRGGIVLGKSNAPELGHGGNTFNKVFGATRNPWNTSLTCGGSSGGSAVAVASGQAWMATGSDLGCSLRTPAAFCSVVGLRPSPGRVARGPTRVPFDNLWVQGPMARDVGDVALMLDAMVGQHAADPISLEAPRTPFLNSVDHPVSPKRVAYSADLGGITPVDSEVAEICAAAAARIMDHGAALDEACPDFSSAREIFRVLRGMNFVGDLGQLVNDKRADIRPEVVWNTDQGFKLSMDKVGDAERARGQLYGQVEKFFETYDLLITPAAIVPPFALDLHAVDEVNGRKFENYYDWYTIAYAITITSLPALSLPCGFTKAGLPVALQLVGRSRGEAELLSAAALLESVLGIAPMLPIDPIPPAEWKDKLPVAS